MDYLSCEDVAKSMGTTVRRVQQMCKKGEIEGAVKEGHSWVIPFEDNKSIKELPVGVSDFKIASTNYYYVDKTLLIKDFLDTRPMVSLFTRPRRFGKTLNMDMLRVFFEKTSEDTSIYFKDKKIWKCGEKYIKHQGKYPVIFLTFKDVKCLNWEDTFAKIRALISLEFIRHIELETSQILNVYEKEQYKKYAKGNVNEIECQSALQILSLLLHKHYKKEAIIIMDEYDTPIQQGHACDFYEKTINFMRNFFSGGLKDNSHLAFGFLTGILRVAKESIFSDLNNIVINSILDERYSEYFGFTEDEVKEMLKYYKNKGKYKEVCDWYDGYRFGNLEIFNPWSLVNYVSNNCKPKAFWLSTGSNDIVGEIITLAMPEVMDGLYKLLCDESIITYIDTGVIYPEIGNNPYSIYSFLLMTGYLKVKNIFPQDDGSFVCDVMIPNKEINFVYKKEILDKTNQNNISISINQAILSGDVLKLQSLLENFMLESISSMDTASEAFYHGMMLGLCAVIGNKYQIYSNRESGLGRFDIELVPLTKNMPGFIFELKYTKDEKTDLNKLASSALIQIENKKYDTDLFGLSVNSIIKMGIAFCGKKVVVKKSR